LRTSPDRTPARPHARYPVAGKKFLVKPSQTPEASVYILATARSDPSASRTRSPAACARAPSRRSSTISSFTASCPPKDRYALFPARMNWPLTPMYRAQLEPGDMAQRMGKAMRKLKTMPGTTSASIQGPVTLRVRSDRTSAPWRSASWTLRCNISGVCQVSASTNRSQSPFAARESWWQAQGLPRHPGGSGRPFNARTRLAFRAKARTRARVPSVESSSRTSTSYEG
jgi:hypothetical protein